MSCERCPQCEYCGAYRLPALDWLQGEYDRAILEIERLRAELVARGMAAVAPRVLLPIAPQWTTTPPTEPGWYWGWKDHGAVEYFEVCEVAERHGKLCVMITNHEDECDLDRFTHWLRIEAPEVPK